MAELKPIEINGLWSLQGGAGRPLEAMLDALFPQRNPADSLLQDENLSLLKPWPHQALLLSGSSELPETLGDSASRATDVSHGFMHFRVDDAQAIACLASHLSADLESHPGSCLRCRLEHYPLILWRVGDDRLELLVERSLAQSLVDYVERLALRWRPVQRDNINSTAGGAGC